jgi:hypothetical protein
MPGTFVNAKLRDKSIKTIPTHCQKRQFAPYLCIPIHYGAKKQYATQESKAPLLDDKAKQFIQQDVANSYSSAEQWTAPSFAQLAPSHHNHPNQPRI